MENLTDFDFYLKFTKPLILNLPETNDRVLAAAWVKKLTNDSTTEEKIKVDYLKLLLFVLQRKTLVPPFTQHPNSLKTLEKFPENQTLVDVAKTIIEKEHEEKREKKNKRLLGESGDYPPYVSDFSADLLEYVAVQNIDNFGVHGYYAISKLPLNTWYRVDKQLLPKAAKSMIEVSGPPPALEESLSSPQIVEKSPEKPAEQPPSPEKSPPSEPPAEEPAAIKEEPPVEPEKSSPSPKKKKESPRKSSLGATPPSRPIGKISPHPEDREPPTWGSNLLEAKLLQEEVGDIFAEAGIGEEFNFTSSPSANADLELLWKSSPGRPSRGASPGLIQDEGFPFISGIDDDLGLDTSMPSFLDTSMAYVAGSPVPSPEVIFPSFPQAPKPPKKSAPKIKPTRASTLLQKKKAAELEPPPTQPKKKPLKVGRKGSKAKVVAPPPPAEEEEAEKPPPKRGLKKPSIRRKKVGKSAEATVSEALLEGGQPPQFSSPGEAFAGWPSDDVQDYMREYNQTLREIESQYQNEMQKFRQEHPQKERPPDASEAPRVSKIARPKRGLSRIARRLSTAAIPKSHAAAVELDQSIHVSPEARKLFEKIIEGPSTSTGILQPPSSPLRHPSPKVSPAIVEEEAEEGGVEEGGAVEVQPQVEFPPETPHASMQSPHGQTGKDPRLVEAFNEMMSTSLKMASPTYDKKELAELGLTEADLIDISLTGLSEVSDVDISDVPEEDVDKMNFSHISGIHFSDISGLDSEDFNMSNISEKNLDDVMEGLEGAAKASPRASPRKSPKASPRASAAKAEPDYEDFEAMERMVEEQMRLAGEDPHARTKPKKSKKEFSEGLKRFLGVHARADAQLEELEAAEATQVLGTAAAPDFDDFEAMERMVEEEMRREGQDPHAKPKRKISRRELEAGRKRFLDLHAKIEAQEDELQAAQDVVSVRPNVPVRPKPKKRPKRAPLMGERSPLGEIMEEDEFEGVDEWLPAERYFGNAEPKRFSPQSDVRQKSLQYMFPDVELPEDFEGLEDEDLDLDPFGVDEALKQEEMKERFNQLMQESPAFSGVPVTTPIPTISPRRVKHEAIDFGLPAVEEHLIRPKAKTPGLGSALLQTFGYGGGLENETFPEEFSPGSSPTKPISARAVHEEDNIIVPTSPSQVLANLPAEMFQMQYESPKYERESLRPVQIMEAGELSPQNKRWWMELDELHQTLYGTPPKQTQPTVFDLPIDPFFLAQSPPEDWASPVSPQLSPKIDVEALRKEIDRGRFKPPERTSMFLKQGQAVKRFSRRPSLEISSIKEVEEPSPRRAQWEGEYLQMMEDLQAHRPIEIERRQFQVPFKYRKPQLLQRRSEGPDLATVEENPPAISQNNYDYGEELRLQIPPLVISPEGRQPGVFDLPYDYDIGSFSPPQDLVDFPWTPPSPASSPTRLALMERVGAAPGMTRQRAPKVSRRTNLATIESPVDYPATPLTRSPASHHQQPSSRRKRTLVRKLKKKRLDFDAGPESPDEKQVEMTEVKTELDEFAPIHHFDYPGAFDDRGKLTEISPPEGLGPVLTPTQELRNALEERSLISSPSGKTPERPIPRPPTPTPPSPASKLGAMRATVERVKRSRKPDLPPSKIRWQRYHRPVRKMPQLTEQPIDEAVEYLHQQLEDEVDAELAAQADAERRKHYSLLDEPVPGHLESPLRPPVTVPFYETPPHLRRQATPSPKKPLRIMPRQFRNVLDQEEMPDYVSPETSPYSPPPLHFIASGVRSPTGIQGERIPDVISPATPTAITDEQYPEGFASPSSPFNAADVQKLAAMQYAQLGTPRSRPRSMKLSEEDELAEFERLERLVAESPEDQELDEFERLERLAEHGDVNLLEAATALPQKPASPSRRSPRAGEQRAPSPGVSSPRRRAAEQYAALLAPSPGVPTPRRLASPDPIAVTSTRTPLMPSSQVGILEETPPGEVRTPQQKSNVEGTLLARYSPGYYYESMVPSPEIAEFEERLRAEKLAAEAEAARIAAEQAAAVEIEYQERVKEKKATKGKKKGYKHVKSRIGEALKGKQTVKEVKSDKSVASDRSAASDASVKSQKSDQSVKAKPKRKKFKVASKIDTGRKTKKVPPQPTEPPPVEVQYDVAALEDLGLTAADLQNLNLDDENAIQLEAEQPYVRPGPRKLSPIVETEEEHFGPSPLKWDMRWHLSPGRRAEMRAPDVKVMPSPIKDSRYKFERVALESPQRMPHEPLLPVRREEVATRNIESEAPPDMFYEDESFEEQAAPVVDVEEEWARLAAQEAEDDLFGGEGPPGGVYLPVYSSPSPIKRRIPIGGTPVSPSKLGAELEAHEYYDPESRELTKRLKIKGKYIPVRKSQRPSMSPIYEGTPPSKPPIPRTPEEARCLAQVLAEASLQYKSLLQDTPPRSPPRLPTPRQTPELMRIENILQDYRFKPSLYRKTFPKKKAPNVRGHVPMEAMETESYQQPSPQRQSPVAPIGSPAFYPPLSPLTPPKRRIEDEDYFDILQSGQQVADVSPQLAQSPVTPTSPQRRSPVAQRSPQVEEFLEILEGDAQAADISPQLADSPVFSPQRVSPQRVSPQRVSPQRVSPEMILRSPTSPDAFLKQEPVRYDNFGLPEVHDVREPSPATPRVQGHTKPPTPRRPAPGERAPSPRRSELSPPTPKVARSPQVERRMARRRLDFDQPPPPESPPQREPMSVLTVAEEVFELPYSPPKYDAASPEPITSEDMPSFMQSESPATPGRRSRSPQIPTPDMPSVLEAVSPWGREEEIPEDLKDFKWLDAQVADDDDLPWRR